MSKDDRLLNAELNISQPNKKKQEGGKPPLVERHEKDVKGVRIY